MKGRGICLPKVLASVAAACLALASISPSFAKSDAVGTAGDPNGQEAWLAGPEVAGTGTIVGRIEAPRAKASVKAGASLQISGWAADTTARGWSGIDGVEVWHGAQDQAGTRLARGMVGLNRADIGQRLGSAFIHSGFSAVVPSSALKGLSGKQTLYVYLHTPDKGVVSRSLEVNIAPPPALKYPDDPIVFIARPQQGMAITQRQKNNTFTFNGVALDRNPITDPATQLAGPGCSGCTRYKTQARGAGIASVALYIDSPKGDPVFGNFGKPCSSCVETTSPMVSNLGNMNVAGKPQGSLISRQYGSQFDFSGWSATINPAVLSPGFHTLYVTATSSITGKQSTASVTFQILDASHENIQPGEPEHDHSRKAAGVAHLPPGRPAGASSTSPAGRKTQP